jgi:dsDNA-specific endonuclease/ATPase MutS2
VSRLEIGFGVIRLIGAIGSRKLALSEASPFSALVLRGEETSEVEQLVKSFLGEILQQRLETGACIHGIVSSGTR